MLAPVTSDTEGRFRLEGAGRDRAVELLVTGPGIRPTNVTIIARDDVADFTQVIRTKYPRDAEGRNGAPLFGPAPTIEIQPARTIAGVVRNARTGEPISAARMWIDGSEDTTDRNGRYRIARDGFERSLWVRAYFYEPGRYLNAIWPVERTNESDEITADFDLEPGVLISGRVVESGTDRPIVSHARYSCGGPGPGEVIAGFVYYYPLATNAALRGTPAGRYFEDIPLRVNNHHNSAMIDEDGRFRMVVPPGPGVLMVKSAPGMPDFGAVGVWRESAGIHRLFPYSTLKRRAPLDGAPGTDPNSFPGFNGPIGLDLYGGCEAYRVIDPAPDAEGLDLTVEIPRAPSRRVRFVDPRGRRLKGAMVAGLASSVSGFACGPRILLEGADAEVLAIEPGKPRELTALSRDGKLIGRSFVSAEDSQPQTIRLQPAGTLAGLLRNATGGAPLAGFSVLVSETDDDGKVIYSQMTDPVKSDAEGPIPHPRPAARR